jgi:rhamnose utilization protein RhaD (predicted bifunctional aldolase and dehydrogenase)
MSDKAPTMKQQVIAMCAEFGRDPLLVQGAGGNVSWKDGNTLWVKASGTWLADAETKDIFVPVDLADLKASLNAGHFSATPKVIGAATLKPSIETVLHGLMPHPVVAHLHAIDILAHLVREDVEVDLKKLVPASVNWFCIPYFKPGAELASQVHSGLSLKPEADVVFLENHGVVIGGQSVVEIRATLAALIQSLREPLQTKSALAKPNDLEIEQAQSLGLKHLDMEVLNALVADPDQFERIERDWALYPDHVVFLGAQAMHYKSMDELTRSSTKKSSQDELIFIQGVGVFAGEQFGRAKVEQIICYVEIVRRQNKHQKLKTLTYSQVRELLSWDAEKHRQTIAK